MKSTLKKIAEATGYSISTVSRSLANSKKISVKTREEIQQTADRIGYKATPRKRQSRKKSKQLHFALLSDFRVGEFYAKLFCGYRDASYEEDVRISLHSVLDQRVECTRFIERLQREDNYDGIILFFPELHRDDYLQVLQSLPQDFPIVSNAQIENPAITTITFDGYSGGYLAAEHFHRQDYRRLGIIEGPLNKPETRFRYNGFVDYINGEEELELVWKFAGDYEYEGGVRAFRHFMEQQNATGIMAEAVFATNDTMATGFMQAAKQAGLNIPGDVAVLGHDDLPTCIHREPKLSSIHTDFTYLASSTIQTLKNKIYRNEHQHGTLSLVRVDISVRDSSVKQAIPVPAMR